MTQQNDSHGLIHWHGTTIVGVKRGDSTVIAGDGQVSMGNTVMKPNARKVRRIGAKADDGSGKVIAGFAGATADAFTLFDKLEARLGQYNGNLLRAAVELAKDWRTDKMLRRLEALLVAADQDRSLLITGAGDVIEADDGILAIGSGGPYAQSAAKALVAHSDLDAEAICRAAMNIAASICIYTNSHIVLEKL